MKVSRYWKAIVAAVVAGAGTAGTALDDGRITGPEAAAIALAVLGGLGFTWAVPNRTTPAAVEPPKV
jgi:hypothetical protein